MKKDDGKESAIAVEMVVVEVEVTIVVQNAEDLAVEDPT
jgi:hypothetical protein